MFYTIELGSGGEVAQSELIQVLKSNRYDVIQTANGLCVKGDEGILELIEAKAPGTAVGRLDPGADDLAADVRAFVQK